MYKYNINIKSGTGGWYDYDGCDYSFGEFKTQFIPRIGETISINLETDKVNPNTKKPLFRYYNFLVRDVVHWISNNGSSGTTVYVIATDGYECK